MKYKIGYTTGTFDMFHIGHLNVLKNAKAQCDHLIVGVSTDELVESYKHHKPAIPYEQRKAIIEALRYVDEVVPQVNRDKIEAAVKYNIDVMFVGSDWKGSEIFEQTSRKLEAIGKKLVFLPHTDGISTSMLREAISSNKPISFDLNGKEK